MKCPSETPRGGDRRGFIVKTFAVLLGAVSLSVPAVIGIIAFFNPLRQKAQGGRFVRLASLDVLPDDGTPRKFSVIADRTDAWNRFANQPIGAVFLRKTLNKDQPVEAINVEAINVQAINVEAINVVCPHAGCSIQYQPTPEGGKFFCPCHNASFDLESGKPLDDPSPSPRDLDTLEVEIRDQTEVWVKFEKFDPGTSRKIVRT